MKVITGSTGGVGGEAARWLTQSGTAVRLLVRNSAKAPQLPHAEIVQAAYDDSKGLLAGLRPGDDVFMVSVDASHDQRMTQHVSFVRAAAEARVGHIVYLSFMAAGPNAKFLHAQAHGETEDLIKATGIPYTFLRTSFYDRVTTMFYLSGLAHGPGGQGHVSWVSRPDCGAVVAAVMQNPQAHAGEIYDISGPAALSLDETSALISEMTGLDYRYSTATTIRRSWPRACRRAFRRIFRSTVAPPSSASQRGEFGIVTDVVERLTGRPPSSLQDFIAGNRSAYALASR